MLNSKCTVLIISDIIITERRKLYATAKVAKILVSNCPLQKCSTVYNDNINFTTVLTKIRKVSRIHHNNGKAFL